MKNKKITYGIVGLGRFGMALAQRLAGMGAEILAVDKDEGKVKIIREYTQNAFIAKDLEKDTLAGIGLGRCDVAVVCIAEEIAVSILTVMKLLGLGVKRVIAKANSQEHGEILQKLGAEVVYPEKDMAHRLASRLEVGHGVDFIELSETIRVVKFDAPKSYLGKKVSQIYLRNQFGVNIIAIENTNGVMDNVSPEYEFIAGDTLYVCGNKDAISRLLDWLDTHHN